MAGGTKDHLLGLPVCATAGIDTGVEGHVLSVAGGDHRASTDEKVRVLRSAASDRNWQFLERDEVLGGDVCPVQALEHARATTVMAVQERVEEVVRAVDVDRYHTAEPPVGWPVQEPWLDHPVSDPSLGPGAYGPGSPAVGRSKPSSSSGPAVEVCLADPSGILDILDRRAARGLGATLKPSGPLGLIVVEPLVPSPDHVGPLRVEVAVVDGR
jgi:hypothetical protein